MSKKRMARAAAMLGITLLVCIACNAAAFLIDTPAMRDHAWQGALMLGQEGGTPQIIGGFRSAQLDNFTSVLIVKTAAYTGPENLLEKTLGGLRTEMPPAEGQSGWEAFCTYEDGGQSPTGGLSYSRYWHGYTLPLRLLLCVLNLANIQMLLYYAQLALFVAVLALMVRRRLGALLPGFFTAYFLLMPATVSVCLQYVPVSMLMLLICAALLLWDDRIADAVSLPGFFALVGLLTNYFDLLTFPLATLGFPLALLLALRLKTQDGAGRVFGLALACCAGWGLGYGGMWAMKWLLVGAAFGWDQLLGVLGQIFLRASAESGGVQLSRLDVLRMNVGVITGKASYLLLLGAAGLATLLPAVRRKLSGGISKRGLSPDLRALALLVPMALPFLWYLVMANHSYDHTYFTYRNLTVSVMAGYALLACLLEPEAPDRIK